MRFNCEIDIASFAGEADTDVDTISLTGHSDVKVDTHLTEAVLYFL